MIDPDAEDIHMFVEADHRPHGGRGGKRLHTARSRNDQVALDVRLYLLKDAAAVECMQQEGLRESARACQRKHVRRQR